MAEEFLSVRMADLSPDETHELLSSAIVPRPIAFISTCDVAGNLNLAPFSFFTAGGSNPASVVFSSTLNAEGHEKDTLRNVLDTREFVVNAVHRAMAPGMVAASIEFGSQTSEWAVAGYTVAPSVLVRPPRVRESLVQLECRLFQIVEHGSGPSAARYVIGEVLLAHLSPEIAADPAQLRTISRLGGRIYADLASMELFRLSD
ncbi:MAG TPA: flavin reductase family protein [Fimbriimonadaceae bacterium]|nr:flavin reductase family protein [Fimbriimonadaceae bacterium]